MKLAVWKFFHSKTTEDLLIYDVSDYSIAICWRLSPPKRELHSREVIWGSTVTNGRTRIIHDIHINSPVQDPSSSWASPIPGWSFLALYDYKTIKNVEHSSWCSNNAFSSGINGITDWYLFSNSFAGFVKILNLIPVFDCTVHFGWSLTLIFMHPQLANSGARRSLWRYSTKAVDDFSDSIMMYCARAGHKTVTNDNVNCTNSPIDAYTRDLRHT